MTIKDLITTYGNELFMFIDESGNDLITTASDILKHYGNHPCEIPDPRFPEQINILTKSFLFFR